MVEQNSLASLTDDERIRKHILNVTYDALLSLNGMETAPLCLAEKCLQVDSPL